MVAAIRSARVTREVHGDHANVATIEVPLYYASYNWSRVPQQVVFEVYVTRHPSIHEAVINGLLITSGRAFVEAEIEGAAGRFRAGDNFSHLFEELRCQCAQALGCAVRWPKSLPFNSVVAAL